MVMTRSMTGASTLTFHSPVALGMLGGSLEGPQRVIPVGVEERAELAKLLRDCAIQTARPVPPLAHEARLAQHAQVLRNGRTSDVEVAGDVPGAPFRRPDKAQDLAAARLGDRSELQIHTPYVSTRLRKCQLTLLRRVGRPRRRHRSSTERAPSRPRARNVAC